LKHTIYVRAYIFFFKGDIFHACNDRACHKENSNATDLLRVVSEEELFFAGLMYGE